MRLRLDYDEEDKVFRVKRKTLFGWKIMPMSFFGEERWYLTSKCLKKWGKW